MLLLSSPREAHSVNDPKDTPKDTSRTIESHAKQSNTGDPTKGDNPNTDNPYRQPDVQEGERETNEITRSSSDDSRS
jgi:hypothetical protein